MPVEDRVPHARHDPHADGDVGRVGEFDADVGERRAERPHAERDHVHRPPAHAAVEQAAQRRLHLPRRDPIVGRARVSLAQATDERTVLDARDVAGVGAGQETAGTPRGIEGMKVPERTIPAHNVSYSAREPSHQWICSGRQSIAISATQARSGAPTCPSRSAIRMPITTPPASLPPVYVHTVRIELRYSRIPGLTPRHPESTPASPITW